jgi:uncharacterized protein (DUF1697 family)
MPRYAALLRGVNVGKGPRVAMGDLRALLGRLGFAEVSTLLNSGNAAFTAPGQEPAAISRRIATALEEELDTPVPVIVVTGAQVATAVAENPFPSADPSRLLLAFTQERETLRQIEPGIRAVIGKPDVFAVGSAVAYLHCPGGIARSKAAEALLGRVGRGATTRNLATTRRLADAIGATPRRPA